MIPTPILLSAGSEMHVLMLNSCTASVLSTLLDPAVPYVWLQGHNPHPTLKWVTATLPLSHTFQAQDVEVRSLAYELLLPTHSFLKLLRQFEPFGLTLCQMRRKPPCTLWLPSIPANAVDRILIENGLFSRFMLPHAHEVASFAAVDSATIDRALSFPSIRALKL